MKFDAQYTVFFIIGEAHLYLYLSSTDMTAIADLLLFINYFTFIMNKCNPLPQILK